MTDSSPGPGWWLASDGNWYPPHLHPAVLQRDDAPDSDADAGGSTQSDAELLTSSSGGIDWEQVERELAERRSQQFRASSTTRRRVALVSVAVIVLLGIVIATRGNDDSTEGSTANSLPGPGSSITTMSGARVSTAEATSTIATPTTSASAASGPTTTASAVSVSVFSLESGACIDQADLTTGLITTVRRVACTTPHTHEVYLKATITPANATYDAQRVTAFANEQCTAGFKTYVGIPYDESKYYFLHLAPSAESWAKNNDREVVCLLLQEGKTLTTSAKGKGE
jgi:Septum formation